MFKVYINHIEVELFPGQSFNFVRNNPAFVADALKGDKSYPINFPVSDHNRKIFSYMDDTRIKTRVSEFDCVVINDGITVIRGKFKVKNFGNTKILGDIYTGISLLFGDMAKLLPEMDFGGDLTDPIYPAPNHYIWAAHHRLYSSVVTDNFPFTFFPVKNEGFAEGADTDYDYLTRTRLKGFMNHFIPIDAIDSYNSVHRGCLYHAPNVGNTMAPFLIYVVKKIFENIGFGLKGELLNDPDFEKIVILSLNAQAYGNDIAKALPNLRAWELIEALAAKFNLGIYYDALSSSFSIDFNKNLFNYSSVQDWTEKIVPGKKVYPSTKSGYTIADTLDGQDKYASNFLTKKWENVNLKGTVSTFNNLPYTGVKIGDVWFVTDEDCWYIAIEEVFMTTGSWKIYAHNYSPVVIGKGENEIKANISTGPNVERLVSMTEDFNCGYPTNPLCVPLPPDKTLSVPIINQKGNNSQFLDSVGHPAEGNKFGFKIYIWHGLVDSPVDSGYKYSHASASNYLPDGTKNTNFSLYTNGDEGTYAKFWKPFIDKIGDPVVVQKQVYLTAMEYHSLNMKLPVKIKGELFFIKSIKTKLPITGASSVDLIKIFPKINDSNNGTA